MIEYSESLTPTMRTLIYMHHTSQILITVTQYLWPAPQQGVGSALPERPVVVPFPNMRNVQQNNAPVLAGS